MLPTPEGLALAALGLLFLLARRARRTGTPTPRPARTRAARTTRAADPRRTIRELRSRGAAPGAISRATRIPHDVVTLALHLGQSPRERKNMPWPAAPAARRQEATVVAVR
jgi:hypothetical protein